jgi:ATP-dependent helicase/nuclease subunit A
MSRSNRVDPTELETHAQRSIDELLSHLPTVSKKSGSEINSEMCTVIANAISDFEGSADTTKKSIKYMDGIKSIAGKIQKGYASYTDWAKLAKPAISSLPGKKSEDLAERIKDQAALIESHPELHEDLTRYIKAIYEVASKALTVYSQYKAKRGLIDFIDQEERLLGLLDNPVVIERLQEDMDLLLVDEFQDTSPIQLAIFLKLSKLVKKTIWVGDPKQSIYAFRGADPSLMLSMIDNLGGVKKEDIQDTSYRSREDLVKGVNTIFKKVFPFDEEQIVLKPVRPELDGLKTALETWNVNTLSKDETDGKRPYGEDAYIRATANSIKDLTNEGRLVVDKVTKKTRPVRPGDVSVLMRSNKACEMMAGFLEEEGLRVAMEREGLLGTEEGSFLRSCLSFIINPYDSLANAEIQVFSSEGRPIEEMLNDRLKYLESEPEELWGVDNDWIKNLKVISESLGESTSSEVIDRVLIDLNLREYVKRWGNSSLRSANIDQFRSFAVNYESECKKLGAASTLPGFLIWLSSQEKLSQAAGTGTEAVNVMTYHKSKGLEWPVVIMCDLDKGAFLNLWGSKVIDPREEIDMDNPLGERWIRTWINPVTGSSLPFIDRMKDSQMAEDLLESSMGENARLLYVGMTRARDYLIMASRKFEWMTQQYQMDMSVEKQGLQDLPWDPSIKMEGRIIKMHPLDQYKGAEFNEKEVSCLKPKKGRGSFEDLYQSPSSAEGETAPFSGEFLEYGERLSINEKVDADILGTALHNLVALGTSVTEKQILRTLYNFGMKDTIKADEAKTTLLRFEESLSTRWPNATIHRELPVQMMKEGKIINGIVDMLVENDDELILIDHKSYQGAKDKLAEKAGFYRPQLELYKVVLEEAFGKPVKGSYINFLVTGSMLEMGK